MFYYQHIVPMSDTCEMYHQVKLKHVFVFPCALMSSTSNLHDGDIKSPSIIAARGKIATRGN